MTETILLEGKKVGEKIREEIRAEIEAIQREAGKAPRFICLMVGNDPAAESYRRAQERTAQALGVRFDSRLLPAEVSEKDYIKAVDAITADADIHGVILQLPLPAHIDVAKIYPRLDPRKDIEGIHPATLGFLVMRKARLVPATPLAVMTLLDSIGYDCKGKEAFIIGQSAIVGRPLQLLLGERRALTVVGNTGTPLDRMAFYARQADVLISCAGKPGLVQGDWIKEGAVVIDVGTTEVQGKITGDVAFEDAKKRAKYLTPVPGGVGPLTVLMLIKNLIKAYRWQAEDRR